MHRKLGAVALASALFIAGSASAFAADQSALAPGKPAGVKQAAMIHPVWIWVVGIGFVAGGLAFAAAGNSNGHSGGSTSSTHL